MFITMVNIAIDGPAGAGKSTVARGAAKALGYIYVDTGALYRTVALYVLQNGHNVHDSERVKAALADIRIELKFVGGVQRVYLNGRDVSEEIRTPEVSMGASAVAALPCVREFLFEQQRRMAREKDCIMDGRDIGTVVLPDAQVKVFLTASAEERARRRYRELLEKGEDVLFEEVLRDVQERDYNDSHRAVAPLKQAEDAVLLDTTGITLEESVSRLIQCIKERSQ